MDNTELNDTTTQELNRLNYFMVHTIVYFVINLLLVFLAFEYFETTWWIVLPVIWALLLIYHGLRVFGTGTARSKSKAVDVSIHRT